MDRLERRGAPLDDASPAWAGERTSSGPPALLDEMVARALRGVEGIAGQRAGSICGYGAGGPRAQLTAAKQLTGSKKARRCKATKGLVAKLSQTGLSPRKIPKKTT